MSTRTVEFYFDIGSPYSYLAATQMRGLAERTAADVQWKPFLLGGVFKAIGSGPPASLAPKARYMIADLGRWAGRYGVELHFPSRFPLNTLKTQRALVAAERLGHAARVPDFALALYDAYWVHDRDVSDPSEIARIAEHAGLDPAAIAEAMDDQATKDLLRERTDEAVRRGAFGAPTLFIGDEMFFGNDRLPFVEERLEHLAGTPR
ncbi:MAG: 2-hydroxychromene-2-carboxylate isomerase [Myxococcota bacterium]